MARLPSLWLALVLTVPALAVVPTAEAQTTPTFDPLTRPGPGGTTITIGSGDDHPFDVVNVTVHGSLLNTVPFRNGAPGNDPVFARLWRETYNARDERGVDEYWAPAASSDDWTPYSADNDLEVRWIADPATGASTFQLNFQDINECAKKVLQFTCVDTGTYRFNIYAKHAGGVVCLATPCCVNPSLENPANECSGGLVLTRDKSAPTIPAGQEEIGTGKLNRIASLPDLPGAPGADRNAVQQGTFLPVSLYVRDQGSGFRNVTFRYMTKESNYARIAKTTFGEAAVACTHVENHTEFPEAVARIPASAADCDIVPQAGELREVCVDVDDEDCAPPFVVCWMSHESVDDWPTSPPLKTCDYQTNLCHDTPTNDCDATSAERTPYVFVSTDAVPFGTYKLQVATTDWAGRTATFTMAEVFTVVPRVVVDAEKQSKVDGKIDLGIYAGFTDVKTSSGSLCDKRQTTADQTSGVPSWTSTCFPATITVDYLPPGATAAESNYENLYTFNGPPVLDDTPHVLDLANAPYKPYGRHPVEKESSVGFYHYELNDYAPPSGVTLPEPPVVRISVYPAVGSTVVARTTVTLSTTDLVDDLVPKKPFTEWAVDREPTFYKAPGSPHPATTRGVRLPDLVFENAFNPAGIAPKDTGVYVRIYDLGPDGECDLETPSNPADPCRLVYWAVARSDSYSKEVPIGRNWNAGVDISSEASIEAERAEAGIPVTPTEPFPLDSATFSPPDTALTRGIYVLEVTAHTKSGTDIDEGRVLAYLARTFRVETKEPTVRFVTSTAEVLDGRSWTGGRTDVEATFDVGHFVKTTKANVSVGVQLAESSGRSWLGKRPAAVAVEIKPVVVKAATTGPVDFGALPSTLDGVGSLVGQRVLVKDQPQTPTDPDDPGKRANGVYDVISSTEWARSRVSFVPGLVVDVEEGSTNAGSGWILTKPAMGSIEIDDDGAADRDVEFTRYTTGSDGVLLQRYRVPVDVSGEAHGTSFQVYVNLTGNNRTLTPSSFPVVKTLRPLTLDRVGPVVRFDLQHEDVDGDDLVDGKPKFHGTVDDGIGAGPELVKFAVKRLDDGKFYDGSGFHDTLEGKEEWLGDVELTDLAEEPTESQKVWTYEDTGDRLATAILKEPDNFLLYAQGFDKLGNKGIVVTAKAIADGSPPVLGANATDPASDGMAYDRRTFAIEATDRGVANARGMTVNLHLLPPSGRLHTFPMKVAGTTASPSPVCVDVIAKDQCWSVTLDEELGWVGDVSYFFSATDAANNTFCSYGPCDGDPAKRPELPKFHLEDDEPPSVESIRFDPAIPASGGVVAAIADIREAAGFLEGYPKAYFYVDGVEAANGTMRKFSEEAVDPASGAGLWTLSTLDLGIEIEENQTLRVVIVVRDVDDRPGDPKSKTVTVSANVEPIVTVVSPAPGTTNYVGRTANVTVHVDDVNVDPRSFTVDYAVEAGAKVRDTLPANVTDVKPLRTLGKTLGWTFTYRGGVFPDGANVTFTFGARDNLTARNETTFKARVDAVGPTVSATVGPKSGGAGGTTYVGPLTTVVLSATDAVTPGDRIRIEYSVNGGSTSLYSAPVPVTGGETFTLRYAALDLAGNRADGGTLSYAIDRKAPAVAVVTSGENTTITATDDLSGVDDENVTLHYKTSRNATEFARVPLDHATGNIYTATLGAAPVTFIYYVEAPDEVGNVGHATVGGVTCSRETPCGLPDTGGALLKISFVAPADGADVTGAETVQWTAEAAPGATASVKLEAANATERILVKGGLPLVGTTTFDPAALDIANGDWVLVLTVDDGVNTPKTASRTVHVDVAAAPDPFGAPATPAPTAPLAPGQAFTTLVPVNDAKASKVKATVLKDGEVVRETEFEVVAGVIDFRFSETAPGTYHVRLTPVYEDGTTGASEDFPGTFRVQGASTSAPAASHLVQVAALVAVGALVVALAAVGAFRRWK